MLELPPGPFGCILADPPWAFKTYSRPGGKTPSAKIANHYNLMDTFQIAALPVAEITAPNAALFMWVVDSNLPDATLIAESWGFTFRTCAFIWVKSRLGGWPHIGMGYWTRKQAEQCWLFTRGKPKRLSKGVEQIIHCPRGAHSAKPAEQYARIEALVGGPYLELFSRSAQRGWTAWGDQTGIRDGGLFAEPAIQPDVFAEVE